jgi:hypothetical protein
VEDAAVDVRSSPFRRRAILRARATGGSERDRPAGTYEHTDRASDLLRRERERVLLSGQEWPSFCGERASGVDETNRISAGGNPTLCTLVVVPEGLPRAIPV